MNFTTNSSSGPLPNYSPGGRLPRLSVTEKCFRMFGPWPTTMCKTRQSVFGLALTLPLHVVWSVKANPHTACSGTSDIDDDNVDWITAAQKETEQLDGTVDDLAQFREIIANRVSETRKLLKLPAIEFNWE